MQTEKPGYPNSRIYMVSCRMCFLDMFLGVYHSQWDLFQTNFVGQNGLQPLTVSVKNNLPTSKHPSDPEKPLVNQRGIRLRALFQEILTLLKVGWIFLSLYLTTFCSSLITRLKASTDAYLPSISHCIICSDFDQASYLLHYAFHCQIKSFIKKYGHGFLYFTVLRQI